MSRSKPKKLDLVGGQEVDSGYTHGYWDVDPEDGEALNRCIALLYYRIRAADARGLTSRAERYAAIRMQLMQLRREWRDLDEKR